MLLTPPPDAPYRYFLPNIFSNAAPLIPVCGNIPLMSVFSLILAPEADIKAPRKPFDISSFL